MCSEQPWLSSASTRADIRHFNGSRGRSREASRKFLRRAEDMVLYELGLAARQCRKAYGFEYCINAEFSLRRTHVLRFCHYHIPSGKMCILYLLIVGLPPYSRLVTSVLRMRLKQSSWARKDFHLQQVVKCHRHVSLHSVLHDPSPPNLQNHSRVPWKVAMNKIAKKQALLESPTKFPCEIICAFTVACAG